MKCCWARVWISEHLALCALALQTLPSVASTLFLIRHTTLKGKRGPQKQRTIYLAYLLHMCRHYM